MFFRGRELWLYSQGFELKYSHDVHGTNFRLLELEELLFHIKTQKHPFDITVVDSNSFIHKIICIFASF